LSTPTLARPAEAPLQLLAEVAQPFTDAILLQLNRNVGFERELAHQARLRTLHVVLSLIATVVSVLDLVLILTMS
jgi:hypothetical protein